VHPDQGINYALMFLASEPLYFEAIRDAEICNDMHRLKVFPVSPNTLAVMLRSIEIAYGYYRVADGFQKTLADIEKARKHLANFKAQFERVGEELTKAQDAFRKAETHFDRFAGSVGRLTGESEGPAESAAGPAPD
ncbi:MAG: DNA recombination protein RmuC, partial [bacterium]